MAKDFTVMKTSLFPEITSVKVSEANTAIAQNNLRTII